MLAAVEGLATAVEENAQDERLPGPAPAGTPRGSGRGQDEWLELLLVPDEQAGVLVLTGRIIGRLTDAAVPSPGASQGSALEGATIATIAERFGVSHQRISALLRQ